MEREAEDDPDIEVNPFYDSIYNFNQKKRNIRSKVMQMTER